MRKFEKGVTLVELMIALVLGVLLILGLLEVFASAKASYRTSEALGRVQETGRFAIDYLQRDLRMAGHLGCVNDQARFLSNPAGYVTTFVSNTNRLRQLFDATDSQLNFHIPIVGYEAAGTAPTNSISLPATGRWSGSVPLPTYVSSLSPAPTALSDVVVLRFFSAEGIPVESFQPDVGGQSIITVNKDRWNSVIASSGYTSPGLLGISDCINAASFQATTVNVPATGSTVTITVREGAGLNRSGLRRDSFTSGQSMLYRAETMVYYVANNEVGTPALFRARYTSAPGAGSVQLLGGTRAEEIVAGVENLQMLFGTDAQTNPSELPTGYISTQNLANAVTLWNRVGLVQVGILSRSTETSPDQATNIRLLGSTVNFATGENKYFRSPYESTVAMRNRLFGN